MITRNNLKNLIKRLPLFIQDRLNQHIYQDQLIEIILDLGQRPEVRLRNGSEYLSQKVISWQDLEYTTKQIGKFSYKNRTGVEKTLHRISCIRNRQFLINGLTFRIGRVIFGTISIIRDLLESNKSILILGKPGIGKTTIIREIARVLADEMKKRVIVIDTSNEIAGDSDIAHFGIGKARRMQVIKTDLQHQTMIEAIENHMPQVIIIDEIGNDLEVLAIRTIAEKGIQLIGTTHGNCLGNLIKNPSLVNLIGGIQYVTLGDDEAKRRGTKKSILERKTYPSFEIVVEVQDSNFWIIYENVKTSVDRLLRTNLNIQQLRKFTLFEKIQIKCLYYQNDFNSLSLKSVKINNSNKLVKKSWNQLNQMLNFNNTLINSKTLIIYPYSISSNLLKEIFGKLNIKFLITNNVKKASFIIGLKKKLKQNFKLKELAKKKKNSYFYS